jgi:hypothetical protein
MGEFSKDNLLRSWKEIAAYLGCDVRTCHRWEHDRGMPVHRAEGGETKSPVFAYKNELDAWFGETFTSSNARGEGLGNVRRWLKWAAGGTTVLVLAGAFLLFQGTRVRRQPADFAIDGSFFVILDKQKRELGRFDTGFDDLLPESYFRTHFQALSRVDGNPFPCIVIKDINGDGDKEVLLTSPRASQTTGVSLLYCLDRKATEIWHFEAGQELKCGDKTFSPDYRIPGFICHDMDGDGRPETLVFAYQDPDWPCQMAILDASGRKVGEYWNAGYLKCPAFADINGDGREELIIVGVNNEYKGGCLAVFDPRRISGASPQNGKYACREFSPGSEIYYVTVPYADVSEAMGFVVEGFNYVFITKNSRISATYGASLFYEFDFGLACTQVYTGHMYEYVHGQLVKAGKLTSILGAEYLRGCREGVRYWNGSAMVPEPSMNRR